MCDNDDERFKNLYTFRRSLVKRVFLRNTKRVTSTYIKNHEHSLLRHWSAMCVREDTHTPKQMLKMGQAVAVIATYCSNTVIYDRPWQSLFFTWIRRLHTEKTLKWTLHRRHRRGLFATLVKLQKWIQCDSSAWKNCLFTNYGRLYDDVVATCVMLSDFETARLAFVFLRSVTYCAPEVQSPYIGMPYRLHGYYLTMPCSLWDLYLTSPINILINIYNTIHDQKQTRRNTALIFAGAVYLRSVQLDLFLSTVYNMVLRRINDSCELADSELISILTKISDLYVVGLSFLSFEDSLAALTKAWEGKSLTFVAMFMAWVSNETLTETCIMEFWVVSLGVPNVCNICLGYAMKYEGENRIALNLIDGTYNHADNLSLVNQTMFTAVIRRGNIFNSRWLQHVNTNIEQSLLRVGIYPDDLDFLKEWFGGKLKFTKKRRLSLFQQMGDTVTLPPQCPICFQSETNVAITAPCGHSFCIICAPSRFEKCHICKVMVQSKINKIY